jgi:hypothetical protein
MDLLKSNLIYDLSQPRILIDKPIIPRWRNMTDIEFQQWYPNPADKCQLELTGSLNFILN